jgi:hypothetical protein
MRTLTPTVLLVSLILASLPAPAQSNPGGLAARVAELEAQVATLEVQGAAMEAQVNALEMALAQVQMILQFVRVEMEPINSLAGPHWIIEGANVHVRSGSGSTEDGCGPRDPDFPNCESLTGLGNFVVGYNERPSVPRFPPPPPGFPARSGSHNLIVGRGHQYTSYGGFVAGTGNMVSGSHASVSGGSANEASSNASSVSGGLGNDASGFSSWVGGGRLNMASGDDSSVSGGFGNVALGNASSVSGGQVNVASGGCASVSGGQNNEAAGQDLIDRLSGQCVEGSTSVSGGFDRTAPNDFNWAAGSLLEGN